MGGKPSGSDTRVWHVRAPVDSILRVLIGISVAVTILSVLVWTGWWHWPDVVSVDVVMLFDLDTGENIPTLYATLLLALGSILCGVVARAYERGGLPGGRYWDGLTAIFALMATDEYVQLHERTTEPLRQLLGIEGGWLYNAWVVPAALFLLLFGAIYIRFLFLLPRDISIRLVVAGLVFVGGALGLELIGAALASSQGRLSLGYLTAMHVEELMEKVGASLFIAAVLLHLTQITPQGWRIHLVPTRADAEGSAAEGP